MTILSQSNSLENFEFNTEVEILFNLLDDFYFKLSKFTQIKSFKSEWLQISPKSFKTFAKKLHLMKNLDTIDINLICLTEVKRPDMVQIFEDLMDNIHRLKHLNRFQITGDNECFEFGDLWTEYEDKLRKLYPWKVIDLSLVTTEWKSFEAPSFAIVSVHWQQKHGCMFYGDGQLQQFSFLNFSTFWTKFLKRKTKILQKTKLIATKLFSYFLQTLVSSIKI